MKTFTDSEARQRLSEMLDIAKTEEVIIQRSGGESFSVTLKKSSKSPFDVDGIDTRATTKDILEAIRLSRSGG
jgi:hypothetical protein